jgi:hypothetical protein
MHTLVIVFLAIIALASLLQAGAAVAAAMAARKLAQRVDELEARYERELRPGLAEVARVVGTAADVSDKAPPTPGGWTRPSPTPPERVNEAVSPCRAWRAGHRDGIDRQGRGRGHAPRPQGKPPLRPRRRPLSRASGAASPCGARATRRRPSDAAEPPHVA